MHPDLLTYEHEGLTFAHVITYFLNGKTWYFNRAGWNGKNMWVTMVRPQRAGELPYIALYNAQGDQVPWVASHSDMLASDWRMISPEV